MFQDPNNLEEERTVYEGKFKEPPILYLIFCGRVDQILKAYIVFNKQLFAYASPLKAVGVCFKCHIALRYWPFDCDFVWLFIQLWVYKIPNRKSPYFVNITSQGVRTLIQSLKLLEIPKEQTAQVESAKTSSVSL